MDEKRGAGPGRGRPVAVVTGASRGLGFLLARTLGRHGFDLVVCARSADGLDAARDELAGTGAAVVAIPADVSDRAEAEGVVAAAREHFGRLDLLVNNAGMIQVGPAVTMTGERFADALDVILWGTVHTSLAAVAVMREQGDGRIVNISSVGGVLPAPHLLPYTTAKYAVTGFSEGLRVELRKYGITVTTAVPGLMRTGSPRNALFTGDRAAEHRWFALADSIPLLSTDAERAAERIVSATLRGRATVILTPAARLGVIAHGLFPGLLANTLGVVERLLPRGEAGRSPLPGHTVATRPPRWFAAATRLTELAARRFHEYDDSATVGHPVRGEHAVTSRSTTRSD
jgi:NAD(P)-dependent dehydrogenase (short-subunit alcohol dehydrogenase family)